MSSLYCQSLKTGENSLKLSVLICLPEAVKIIKKPKDVTALENAVVSFEVSVSHDTVPVKWMHKNVEIKPSDKHRLSFQRKVHKLTLQNISPADAGEYTAVVGQLECKAKLFVESKCVFPSDVNINLLYLISHSKNCLFISFPRGSFNLNFSPHFLQLCTLQRP